ncbi:uncharacterized protein LAESUDRAFT_647858 [Laetiporus sulphureus 93-53]|uniref:Vps72/YL1 C-terminal domain-containing protein n=1 Tax=Laetiporus sulphureus 93-53 TaxID=1314785 RepID=A0A165FIH8_9APHY|nr:uncharacterized protein LAESUDRAFT_647858 [Laetiporus sulphureus 93-53]KZT09020.1 hypothetical protein LAESUDRAFT_647858 [Laetiporus sulphureus 93-53]
MEDSLVMRRPKRSTAGNRMEAALAEFRAEEVGMDIEGDVDFVIEKGKPYEEDAFESDFESTDEEANQEDVDYAAEKMIIHEERSVQKAARTKLDKVTAAAHARQKATFNPQNEPLASTHMNTPKANRRVSLGPAIDAETGEIVEKAKRHSQRSHTMLSTSATVSRMKDAEEKKSALPKKAKVKTRPPTQVELIARALDMEEGNTIEHRDYLSMEEEKRKKARLVRMTVQGPLLRWISKSEEVKVVVEPPPPAHSTSTALRPLAPRPSYGYAQTYPHYSNVSSDSTAGPSSYVHPSGSSSSSASAAPPSFHPSASSSAATSEKQERIETVMKNYVVHEANQSEKSSRPSWLSTMKAMFGENVNWDELRVYVSKGRPYTRPTQTCSITGRPARYRDPRTNVPFADIEAYHILTKVLAHEYVWSDALGCYVGHQEDGVLDI